MLAASAAAAPPCLLLRDLPLPGAEVEEAVAGFVTGNRKATESVEKYCSERRYGGGCCRGNGNDTFALLKMVADESGRGRVYAMDIQDTAIDSTSSFLKMAVGSQEMELVKLVRICHSRMEEIVPKDPPVRFVTFDLGYLPGGDKTTVTVPKTTELALQAASRIVSPGGLKVSLSTLGI